MAKSYTSIRAQSQFHFSFDSFHFISEHFTFFVSLLLLFAQILCYSHTEILFQEEGKVQGLGSGVGVGDSYLQTGGLAAGDWQVSLRAAPHRGTGRH